MKVSEQWLREWVNPHLHGNELIEKLSLSGLAVESYEPFENDYVFEFELTPNRGDCLSVMGVAREISLITNTKLNLPGFKNLDSGLHRNDEIKVNIQSPESCPRYTGRIIKNFSPNKSTPELIKKRLEKSGIKIIHPIVDVMNYVMIELGQPLHAFDLKKIDKEIIVRRAEQGEEIVLLDGQKVNLEHDVLVIADTKKLLAMAGIMGGLDSAVDEKTTAIFIESAFFAPLAIAGKARKYGLHTDASHRFERGVDFELPQKAIDRATQLLSEIYTDLEISDIIEKTEPTRLPTRSDIVIRPERVKKILGIDVKIDNTVFTPPSYRFDLSEEIDVIEEIARIHGYDNINANFNLLPLKTNGVSETQITVSDIKKKLVSVGYQEVITYSFISEKSQQLFDPEHKGIALSNPLSAELAVMRTNLWPGLLEVVTHNLNRQQEYIKLFEQGLRFVDDKQEAVISGVWAGKAYDEQWGESTREVDFFDLKNNLENLGTFTFEPGIHHALHPGQTAKIIKDGKSVGLCGALHPKFDSKIPVFLFEIELVALLKTTLPSYKSFSKFPTIRRDLALTIDKSLTAQHLENVIKEKAGDYLIDLRIFDVYRAKNSIAIGLIFQAPDRTLLEEEIDTLMHTIIEALAKVGATLRG